MFLVPRRQQSPGSAEASGEGFLLPCLVSWHSGAAGMLCQEWEGSEDRASSAARLVCCPSFPAPVARTSPIPALPAFPGGPCCPTQQGCVRRTRRHTSLLLYTNRAGIRTQCCPRQEGGRQTEREGDIREVTQNRLRLYGRKQAATTTVRGEDSAVSHGRAQSTPHWDRPRRDNTAQSPSCWPRWFPSLTQKQEHIWEHRRPLSHGTVPGRGWPKEKKGGEGQRHKGEEKGGQVPSV